MELIKYLSSENNRIFLALIRDYVMRIPLWMGEYGIFYILMNNIVVMIELIFPIKVIFLQMNPTSYREMLDFIHQ